jgi:acetyl esterase/lipase
VESVEDVVLDGPAGGIPGRVYRPTTGPMGTVVYFHGGGWIIGDLDSHDGHCRRIAATASAVVVAVDYRLAPDEESPEQRYLGDWSHASDWRASPAKAESHAGVAPAIIGIGEYDFLLSQALEYGRTLEGAGVPVVSRYYPGLIHGFFGHGSVSVAAERAADELSRDLAALLAKARRSTDALA